MLFGQPELDEKLASRRIRQLRERITHSLYLSPLALGDVHDYLNFRIRASGYKGPDLFNRATARAVERYSHGLIRRINILADKALLSAYARGTHNLMPADIHRAAQDSQYQPRSRWWMVPQWFSHPLHGNPWGGLMGITVNQMGGGLNGIKLCLSQVPGKAAAALDLQNDDGLGNTGQIRATLGVSGANTNPTNVALAAPYNESNEYTLCAAL